ncbi:STAS domain-containing protein [Dermatobacter hominis]|uniref:STAS domain-containing protein n=1 Tax=Dermatobacter hominis TaxID=2884263 RepID=UPI001D1198A2|nr:STAS domain-containing protein [Dermatobacter hominis]UDY37542.1 STAS domain-containing protein [Dermatobacter hominis]
MDGRLLELSSEPGDGICRVSAVGEIDISTVDDFRTALTDALADGNGRVDIDLAAITFMGSEGVRALVDARRAGEDRGVGVRVVGASKVVRTVLTLTDLEELLEDGA